MQINIGNVALTGTIPAEGAQNFKFASSSRVQVAEAIGAAGIMQFPRGNKKIVFTFTVQRVHKDAETSAYFCLSHEAQFPVQDKLTFQTTAGELYYASTVAEVTGGDFTGATTTHAYRVTCAGSASGNGLTLDAGNPTYDGHLTLD